MPKMVCVKCEVEFKPEKNGVVVAEKFQRNTALYKLWGADLWKCPICGVEVVAGFAMNPLAEHYKDDLNKMVIKFANKGKTIIQDKELPL